MTSTAPSPAAAIRDAPVRSFVSADSLPGTSTTIRKALSRATKDGVVVRVRPGIYYKGVSTKYGMTRPPQDEAIEVVLGERGVGPAGYSAARAWGVTTQVPAIREIATLGIRRRIDHVKLVARSNLRRVDLNPKEIALLELLRDPDALVETGWDSLVAHARAALAEGVIRATSLRAAVPGESRRAVRENFDRLAATVPGLAA